MTKEIQEMRDTLMVIYPSGVIRGQKIYDMTEPQIYAIYKSHTKRRIPMNKARMPKKQRQIPGQTSILNQM